MAQLSKWAIFLRAFLVVFLSGTAARSVTMDEGEREAWAEAVRICSADAFLTYLSRFPTGQHVEQALTALSELGAIQVADGKLAASICLAPVRAIPAMPAAPAPVPAPIPVQTTPPVPTDDPY